MALKDASVGPGEYETKSTLKKTGKSFGLKTKVTEPLTYGNGPASYTPSLNSSQFASSLPKSFGFHDANLRATRVGSPLSKVSTYVPTYLYGVSLCLPGNHYNSCH